MLYTTLREIITKSAEQYADIDAVRYKIGKDAIEAKTYAQLRKDSQKVSALLAGYGLKGAHIALTGASSYAWIITYFGIVNSGNVAVPLDVSLPAEDMCELIDRSDAVLFVVDELRRDVKELAKSACPKLQRVISMQEELHELLDSVSDEFEYEPQPEDLCTIMFTSGTTGKSKGVMLTHRNLAENATCVDMGYEPGSVLLSVLPIHHAYCLSMDILKGFSVGATVCLNDSLIRMAKNIKLFRPNIILMVPLMIETLARKLEDAAALPPAAVKNEVFGPQLHTICSGGAYLNPDYIDLFARYDIIILQGYGMTECSPVISSNLSWDLRKDTVGKLYPNCEAKVVDEELWIRGSSVMLGYYKMPEETSETLVDGWLRTGDLGYVDEDQYVHLTGRKKNLIITKNGENVSPEELENRLATNHLVLEVLVREADGVIEAEIFPDESYAQKMGISDIQAALQEIIDACNKEQPSYKRILRLKVRTTEFEKTPSKKIKRY